MSIERLTTIYESDNVKKYEDSRNCEGSLAQNHLLKAPVSDQASDCNSGSVTGPTSRIDHSASISRPSCMLLKHISRLSFAATSISIRSFR